ncbi:MAG TPA: hypothetical protein VE869_13245 [Gemmatimonas sp.]|nr:hypothetical protein [Gemmatimonas sp.]
MVGAGMLAMGGWLSARFGLPRELLWVMGVANMGYGLYSGWLFTRHARPPRAIVALVCANATWAIVCILVVFHYAPIASVFGVAHLAGEGLIVGGLAVLEWRGRKRLATRYDAA